MPRQPNDKSSYIMLLLYLIIQISQYARYFFSLAPLPPRLSCAWSIIHGLHGKLIPLLNTPHFRNFNYRRRRAGQRERGKKKECAPALMHEYCIRAERERSRWLQESRVWRSVYRNDFWPDGRRRRRQQVRL